MSSDNNDIESTFINMIKENEALDKIPAVEAKSTAIEPGLGPVDVTIYEVCNQSNRVVDWGARGRIKQKWRNIHLKSGYYIKERFSGRIIPYKDV